MSVFITQADLDELQLLVDDLAGAGLDGFEPAPDAVAEFELLALTLLPVFAHPDLPPEASAYLAAALEQRGDEHAAGLLAALAALAPAPLGAHARAAAARLAAAGVRSPHAAQIGALGCREAYRVSLGGGEAEVLGALLARPGAESAQPAIVFLEHWPCGGAVVGGALAPPSPPEASRVLLRGVDPSGAEVEQITAPALAKSLRSALAHMVEHEIELPADALPAVAVLEPALTGRAGAWPRPVPGLPEGAGAEEWEEEWVSEEAEELVGAFAEALDGRLRDHAPFMALGAPAAPRGGGKGGAKRGKRKAAKAARRQNRR